MDKEQRLQIKLSGYAGEIYIFQFCIDLWRKRILIKGHM